MSDYNARIGGKMRELVRQWFTAEPLSRYALSFIEDKLGERATFGQLTIIHYYMFSGEDGDIYQAAAAVELFILASDILDDLQDQDAPSKAWMQIPHAVSLHVAASLITLSQQAMSDSTRDMELSEALLRMMNSQLLKSANGQMLDIANEINDEQGYLEMVKQKSSSLLVLACMTGVMLAGRGWDDSVALYASELGIAAQIRNDLRDMLRWDDKSDFLNRKRTMLTLYLIEEIDDESQWIRDYFCNPDEGLDIAACKEAFLERCESSGAVLYGSVMSRMHYNRFQELLSELPADNEWKGVLLDILGTEMT